MNPAKRVLRSLSLVNSLYSTQLSRAQPLCHQVTYLSPSLIAKPPHAYPFHVTHQKLFFSSKSEPIIDLVLSDDWSKRLEQELSESSSKLTHENVMYILKRIDRNPEKAYQFFNWVTEKSGFTPSSAMYSLMLRVLANKDTMKEFWVIVTKMKEQGFYVDEDTYKTIFEGFRRLNMATDATAFSHFHKRMVKDNAMDEVVKEVVEVVAPSDWTYDVEKKLSDMRIPVSENFVLRVLNELRLYPSKVLNVFKWVGENSSFEHNSVTYNAAVRALGRYDSVEEFWSMMKEIKSAGFEVDLDTYIKLSRRFQKLKMLEEAVMLYEQMMDGPFKPSLQDCSTLLRTLGTVPNPNLDLVFRVVKKYEAAGYTLSKSVYDGIHRSLTSAGRFDEADKIMETMSASGYEPDNIAYSQLIFGLCKAKRLEEAGKVLDVMEARGCVPDIKTWTILIQGYCAANEVDNAMLYFAKMMEKNCDADADLLDVLVNGFVRQKKLAGAYKLLTEMVTTARLRPWQATYKNLAQNLLGERKLEEALDLLHLAKKQKYPPFPEPFLQYISKFGTVDDALDFLKALTVKEYPSVSAYQHVIQSFFHEGRHSEAKDFLFKCPHHIRVSKAICSLFGSAETTSAAISVQSSHKLQHKLPVKD
ncbi:hypothetical protein RJ640_030255 [Escallonia rubra]|uniref:Pentatricopeptide repeat-containing protein n=1 Tax=Escallonia rubra TaxID=112253 RepID=A0AA88QRH7_9ASTE|nr:hypothetical protein RJ640_030255 [Escallonia rubra]